MGIERQHGFLASRQTRRPVAAMVEPRDESWWIDAGIARSLFFSVPGARRQRAARYGSYEAGGSARYIIRESAPRCASEIMPRRYAWYRANPAALSSSSNCA